MMNVLRRLPIDGAFRTAIACAFLCAAFSAISAHAQETTAQTPFDRQLARVDFAVSGVGQFSSTTTGTNYLVQTVTLEPSNTLGALVTLRYVKSPFIGFEGNFGYARYTENFTITNSASSPPNATPLALGVQTNATEYTFGYVAHTRSDYFGVHPFAAIGAGTVAFHPTRYGGQGYLTQARAGYYYTIGADSALYANHFGLRAQFRQLIYLAPDYETNYFRDLKRSIASEPSFGFYIKF